MNKILMLFFLPMVGFGQNENAETPKFNFNKSNNYNISDNKKISNTYYNSFSKHNSKKLIINNNDTISSCSLSLENHPNFPLRNKGLINIIFDVIQNGANDTSSIFKNNTNKHTILD